MRKPREIVEGATYHVAARINRSEFLFDEHQDLKEMFFDIVHRTHELYKFSAFAVTVMGNHVHMMIRPEEGAELGKIMNSILSTFAIRFNKMFNCHGHVWYDRYKSKVIATIQQFINTLRYICNNPLRAGMVKNPLDYKFSAVYAIFTKTKTQLVKTILSIINLSERGVLQMYQDYINELDLSNAVKSDTSIGFYPGKPGRPKKLFNDIVTVVSTEAEGFS